MNRESWLACSPNKRIYTREYIEESTCASQPMSGTNTDGFMGVSVRPGWYSLPRRQSCGWLRSLSRMDGVAITV
jgi:hypothetical protein